MSNPVPGMSILFHSTLAFCHLHNASISAVACFSFNAIMVTTGKYLYDLYILSLFFFVCFCQGEDVFNDEALILPELYKTGWMASIDDKKLLSDITIPGTHDTMALNGGPAAECQAWDLGDQLKAGIRYLDLSLFAFANKLTCVTGGVDFQLSFNDVLDTVKAFLSVFKKESVLIRVKPHLLSMDDVEKLVGTIVINDTKVWVKSNMPTLGNIRGKVVFVQSSYFALGVPLSETDRNGDSKVSRIADKEKKLANHLTQASGMCGKRSIVLSHSSGTGFGTFLGMFLTPKKVAKKINLWLYQHLVSHYHPRACLGVIAMDFPGIELIQTVIKFNN
ncbi:hypothetical protein UPYG_G00286380 [Umbra pygmaea]|uniref:Phosphatidylinositol-specific phospholipase C X domain-containing protein n=1 Tax=Umbra pygmaea TaxID=75934 RepID=A0ABD0W424_UMBPY